MFLQLVVLHFEHFIFFLKFIDDSIFLINLRIQQSNMAVHAVYVLFSFLEHRVQAVDLFLLVFHYVQLRWRIRPGKLL